LRDKEGRVTYVSERKEKATADNRPGSPSASAATATDAQETQAHLQNFVDCLRSRQQPNCSFEIGFRSAIACQMAVASYRQGRPVRWDAKREEIVSWTLCLSGRCVEEMLQNQAMRLCPLFSLFAAAVVFP